MTDSDRAEAADRQLNVWRQRLKEGFALPVLLLGIGVDHREGQCVCCVTDEVPVPQLVGLLEQALELLKGKVG